MLICRISYKTADLFGGALFPPVVMHNVTTFRRCDKARANG